MGEDDAIQIPELPAGGSDPFQGNPEHLGRSPPAIDRIGVGKEFANVTQSGRPKDGVGDRMEQHVGVAVADCRPVMREPQPPQPEAVSRFEAVGVVAKSDPLHGVQAPKRETGRLMMLAASRKFSPILPGMHNRSESAAESVIEVAGLAKEYRVYDKPEGLWASLRGLWHRESRTIEALRGVDLRVGRGEFLAMLGPNGAGKTTFLKLLSGIITPTRGAARVLGHVPWERTDDFRRRFALVMGQKNQLWWDLPAAESFRLHQEIYQIEPRRFERIRDELVEMLDVGRLLGQPVRELSLGERMKLELVAALLHEPEVLFLDEPTIGLDVVAQHTIHEFLRNVQRQRAVTVILTTHYMKDVAALCERVVVVTKGSILYDGSLEQIVDRFTTHKVVTLDFEEPPAAGQVERFGFPCDIRGPRVTLRIDRTRIAEVLPELLADKQVRDVSVEDVPLEEIVAGLFRGRGRSGGARG